MVSVEAIGAVITTSNGSGCVCVPEGSDDWIVASVGGAVVFALALTNGVAHSVDSTGG